MNGDKELLKKLKEAFGLKVEEAGGSVQTIEVKDIPLKELISDLKACKEYKGSFAEKVIDTIEKWNRCSDKQRYCLEKSYKQWIGAGKSVVVTPSTAPISASINNVPEAPKEVKANPAEKLEKEIKEVKPEEVKAETPAVKSDAVDESSDINWLDNINIYNISILGGDKIYIKELKPEYRDRRINIKIPNNVMDKNGKVYTVCGIHNEAFVGTSVARVIFGKNIRDLGAEAFCRCTKLMSVDMSQSAVNFISRLCFHGCNLLSDVKLGSSIVRIHEGAFENCHNLKTLKLNSNVESVGAKAFAGCDSLISIDGSIDTIYESAFKGCESLKEFDFTNVSSIGTSAFENTGFEKLVIPSNIRNISAKAFRDCDKLKEVDIEEGCTDIGEQAFSCKHHNRDNIQRIRVPKSVINIGVNAFHNCANVECWVGTQAESHCIGYSVPYTTLDSIDFNNATRIRNVANAFGVNPIERIYDIVKADIDEANRDKVNSEYKLNTDKLVNVDITDNVAKYLDVMIDSNAKPIEPNIQFKAYVNLLQKLGDLYRLPFSKGVLRLSNSFTARSKALYDDGYNKILKVIHTEVDTFNKGGFIAVIMGNLLVYCAELNYATDAIFNCYTNGAFTNSFDNRALKIKDYLRAGDKIGRVATISGANGVLDKDGTRTNVGKLYTEMMHSASIEMNYTRKDSCWYIPTEDIAFITHDNREWVGSGENKRLKDRNGDYSNVVEVITGDKIVDKLKEDKFKKYPLDSYRFYSNMANLSEEAAVARNTSLALVGEESEGQLFEVSKLFNKELEKFIAQGEIIEDDKLTQYLTLEVLIGLMKSHLMVNKDIKWLDTNTRKSLNRVGEYHIGNDYVLEEYKSNIVVKFSNSYMSGTKGAHIFVIKRGSSVVSIKASVLTFNDICIMLRNMTYIAPDITYKPTKLITKADEYDILDSRLFYNFAPIAYTADAWSSLSFGANNYFVSNAYISMYKPTGAYYLTLSSRKFRPDGISNSNRDFVGTIPVVPIGFLNRALTVAATTNKEVKQSEIFREMLVLCDYIISELRGSTFRMHKQNMDLHDPRNYYKVREMLISGETDIKKYLGLIDTRVVYMMGITAIGGVLKKDTSGTDYKEASDYNRSDSGASTRKRRTKKVPVKQEEIEIIDDEDEDDSDIIDDTAANIEEASIEEDESSEDIIDDSAEIIDDEVDDNDVILEDDSDEEDLDEIIDDVYDDEDYEDYNDSDEGVNTTNNEVVTSEEDDDEDDEGISIY